MNLYDLAYSGGLALSAPLWFFRGASRRKVFKAFVERMGRVAVRQPASDPAVLIHAVSLGEINATRAMVRQLSEARRDLKFIVTVTTDTGYTRGVELYGSEPRVTLIRYPLDFTSAIARVLDAMKPSVVVLMELETWPNFILQCTRRKIPVLLVNGRLTERSFRGYRWGGPVVKKMFGRLSQVFVQEQGYADRFIQLGTPSDRVSVTGTMKFDTAQIADHIDGADDLAAAVGLRPGHQPIWVCGSTGPGEEAELLSIYRRVLVNHPALRLVIVPRHPQRFDEVAELIRKQGFPLIRRSKPAAETGAANAVILGDTMGDLRKFYSLADVVFVGRTLVDLGSRQHGSDMIEPAALAKPTIVGPFTGNFAEVMNQFRQDQAMIEVATAEDLHAAVKRVLADPQDASAMGQRARDVVKRCQGATARHVKAILESMAHAGSSH